MKKKLELKQNKIQKLLCCTLGIISVHRSFIFILFSFKVNLNLASPLMTVKCHRQRLMKFDILIAEEVEEMGSLFFPFEGEGAKGVLKKQGIMMVHSLRNSTCLRLRKNRTDVEC